MSLIGKFKSCNWSITHFRPVARLHYTGPRETTTKTTVLHLLHYCNDTNMFHIQLLILKLGVNERIRNPAIGLCQ